MNRILERARPMAASAIILILMFGGRRFEGAPGQIALNVAVGLSYAALPLVPRKWWTPRRLFAGSAALGAGTLALWAIYRESEWIYIFSVWMVFVSFRLSLPRSPFPLVTALLLAAWLYIRFGRLELMNLLTLLIVSVLFYFFLRSRIQRNEMFEMNRRNLAELQDAYVQLQEASAAVMRNAVLEERNRIAGEIHDAVGHSLTSLIVQMQALRYRIRQDPEGAVRSLDEMLTVARQGLQDIRRSVHAIAGDASLPGIAALRSLLSRAESSAGIDCSLETELTDEEIGPQAYETLFRVLQEAVTNIIRHSGAKRVDVCLTAGQGVLTLVIRDDGVAEPGKPIAEGFGLMMMRKRLEEAGGRLRISACAPHGLEIAADIPAPQTREED